MLDVWVVSKCAICEEMKLYFDGRLSNSIAEPVLRQRSAAAFCCLSCCVGCYMWVSNPTCAI